MAWVCKNCFTNNDDSEEFCIVCGAEKSSSEYKAPKTKTTKTKTPKTEDSETMTSKEKTSSKSKGSKSETIPKSDGKAWVCPICKTNNTTSEDFCIVCGTARPAKATKVAEKKTETKKSEPKKPEPKKPEPKKYGSPWICKICYTNNDSSDDYCIVCGAKKGASAPPPPPPPKPKVEEKKPPKIEEKDPPKKAPKLSSSVLFPSPFQIIMAILFIALLVVNVFLGVTEFEWDSWLIYAASGIFIGYYIGILLVSKTGRIREIYPLFNAVVLFLNTLLLIYGGKDAEILFISVTAVQMITSAIEYAFDFHRVPGDYLTLRKNCALITQFLFGVFAVILFFIGEDLDKTAAQSLTLVSAVLFAFSAILATSVYGEISPITKNRSKDPILAVRYTLATLALGAITYFIVRGEIDHRPTLIFTTGIFVLFAMISLLLILMEYNNKVSYNNTTIASNVIFAVATLFFLIVINTTGVRWRSMLQQAACGAVIASSLLHLIATTESRVSESLFNPYAFTTISTVVLGVVNTVLLAVFHESYIGVAIAVYAMLAIPAIRSIPFRSWAKSFRKLPLIVLAAANLLSGLLAYLIGNPSLGLNTPSLYVMNWGVMLIAIAMMIDEHTPLRGYVSTFLSFLLVVAYTVLTIIFAEEFFLVGLSASLISIGMIAIAEDFHVHEKRRGAKKITFVAALLALVYIIVVSILLA